MTRDASAEFRFYEELNDFLPPSRRKVSFSARFAEGAPVRDWLAHLGVPASAVDLVLIDGRSVDLDHPVTDGVRVAVYPVFESFDLTPVTRVRPQPLRRMRFLVDTRLGELAGALRARGLDVAPWQAGEPGAVADRVAREGWVLLTPEPGLLESLGVRRGYNVRSVGPEARLREVLERFDLVSRSPPGARSRRPRG